MGNDLRRDAARTRAAILDAARRHFAEYGYDRTTVRAVAAQAGVSANLITRYFGGKLGMFDAATEVDLRVRDALPGPRAGLGDRIAAHVVARWEPRSGNDPLLMMRRAAATDPAIAARTADYFRRQAVEPLAAQLAVPDAYERAAAVGSLIMGTVMQRYVLAAGPVAQAAPADVARWLGSALQRLLGGKPSGPLLPRR